MFSFDWRVAAAYLSLGAAILAALLWVIWTLSEDLTEQRLRGEYSTERHIQYAEDRIDQECLGLEAPALRDCVHEQIEAARDHSRAEQDLDAQQAMALFTKVMGWTAVAGLAVGSVSVALIYATLRATQEMAHETSRIGEAQVRAYVWFDSVKVQPSESEKPTTKDHFLIEATFRNTGNSPAHSIEIVLDVGLEWPNPKKRTDRIRHVFISETAASGRTLGTQRGDTVFTIASTQKGVLELINKDHVMYVGLTCKYLDIFDKQQVTKTDFFANGFTMSKMDGATTTRLDPGFGQKKGG